MRGLQVHRVFLQVPRVPNMDIRACCPTLASCLDHRHIHRAPLRKVQHLRVCKLACLGSQHLLGHPGGGGQPRSWPWKDTPFPSLTQYTEAR